VRVHLLLDGFGAATDLPWLEALLRPAGVEIALYRPGVRWFFTVHLATTSSQAGAD